MAVPTTTLRGGRSALAWAEGVSGRPWSGFFRCSSNQSANAAMSFAMSGQPWPAPGLTTSFASTPGLLELLDERLGLLERHQLVGVAVDDQRRRVVRA